MVNSVFNIYIMSAPVIPLTSELDSLKDIENAAKATFEHCREMIKDILRCSSDAPADLKKLQIHMNALSESQKEIAGLIHSTNEICNLTDKVNLNEAEATAKFQEILDEYIEENDIDDDQRDILFSVDSFINEEQVSVLNNQEDNDLLVTKATLSYKDPLTQRTMENPVKSKICNHSYERDSIMKYLSDSRKKCPYSGCQNMLGKRDLIDDFVLKVRLSLKEEENSN